MKAQEAPPQNYPFKGHGVSLGVDGIITWPVNITLSQMITQRFAFEMGAGTCVGGIGFTYFITDPGTRRLNYYTSISGGLSYNGFVHFYLPLGATCFGKRNFKHSVDFSVMLPNIKTPFSSETVSFNDNSIDPILISIWIYDQVAFVFYGA